MSWASAWYCGVVSSFVFSAVVVERKKRAQSTRTNELRVALPRLLPIHATSLQLSTRKSHRIPTCQFSRTLLIQLFSTLIFASNHPLSSDIPSTTSTTAAMPYNNTPIAPSKEITGTVSLPRKSCDILKHLQHHLTHSQSPVSRRSSHKTTISTAAAITPPS
jgi:hypothetical protein